MINYNESKLHFCRLRIDNFLYFFVLLTLFANGLLGDTVKADGPQNILVVVNSDDKSSMAIANEYIALRAIPPCNVLHLANVRTTKKSFGETTNASHYWQDIGKPIRDALRDREISDQVDCVAFSTGFPTRVTCNWEKKAYLEHRKIESSPHWHAAIVSTTGITFFGQDFFSKEPTFMDRHANLYCDKSERTRSFSSKTCWAAPGKECEPGVAGKQYRMSTFLTVIRPGGSTLEDGISQLRRSANADYTLPKGLFYFARHSDPRSRTRAPGFQSAATALRELGHKVEIGDHKMPSNRTVVGATLGSPFLDWKNSNSTFAPGAICDNFTSYGGFWEKSQTKLTHFLDNGASAATGMVTEPYTLPSKIPTPFAHVHYARGCTMAESLYQTIENPYEILIVGDPLCAPFAVKSSFTVVGIENGSVLSQNPTLVISENKPDSIDGFDLFIDGRRRFSVSPNKPFVLKIDNLSDGYHELRIAAVSRQASKSVTTESFGFFARKTSDDLDLSFTTDRSKYVLNDEIIVTCNFREGSSIRLIHHYRVVGKFEKSGQAIKIKASDLGSGPSEIYVCAKIQNRDVITSSKRLVILPVSKER